MLDAALVLDGSSHASVTVNSRAALWVLPQPTHDGAKADVWNCPERMRARHMALATEMASSINAVSSQILRSLN